MNDQLLRRSEVAELLNVSVNTLAWWAHVGRGPRWFRLGSRKVMYRCADVQEWLDAQYAGTGGGAA